MLGSILLVDEGEERRAALAQSLGRLGWEASGVESTPHAEPALARRAVDALVVFGRGDAADAIALFERLRKERPSLVRVLVLDGASADVAAAAVNRAQVARLYHAPIDLAELHAALEQLLGGEDARARQRAIEQVSQHAERLRAEHPGLVPPSPADGTAYPIHPTRRLSAWAMAHTMTGRSLDPGESDPARLVDDMVALLLQHPRGRVRLAPGPTSDRIELVLANRLVPLAEVPCATGDAMVVRLAAMARLDPALARRQLGTIGVSAAGLEGRVLVEIQTPMTGFGAELRRLFDVDEIDLLEAIAGPRAHEYRFLGQIGETPLWIVYRALDVTLERQVALKMLRDSVFGDPVASARLLREARATSRSQHPGIVQLLDYGRLPDGRPFLATELVEWPTLRQRLAGGVPILDDTLTIVRNLALALGSAHEAEVLHRSLSPDCIYVDDGGNVKIADFGAAKLLSELQGPKLTAKGNMLGDPTYRAPEYATGGEADVRSDLYSLGCIFYELVTGLPPFVDADPWAVTAAHIQKPVPAPTGPNGPAPDAVAKMIHRALAKAPAARYQTADELVSDLAVARTHPNAQAESKGGRWSRWLR